MEHMTKSFIALLKTSSQLRVPIARKTVDVEKPQVDTWNPDDPDSEREPIGPHEHLPDPVGGAEVTGPKPDIAFYLSEPDFGFEDDPEELAAHAAWLKDYCAKNRRKTP